MHCIETIKRLNTEAAIAGVSRRAKEHHLTAPIEEHILEAQEDCAHEALADQALAGDQTAWEAMLEYLEDREARELV